MAHDIKSPGVSVQVIDQTAYTATTAGTVAAAVGFAEKGPIDEPTLILSKEEFADTFGSPIADNYYLGMFADKFMDYSVSYFTRIAKEVDYEAVVGTVAPALDFTLIPNPELFVQLGGFPDPNNGIYKVTWASGGATYADLNALVLAINTAFAAVTLAGGDDTLDNYLTAQANGAFLEFSADLYRNVIITVSATEDATNNVVAISGAGHIGMADGATSADVGNYAYSFIKIPVDEGAATSGSITAAAAMETIDLNQISAFNLINLTVDGSSASPFKEYEDINITPSTGDPATFPILLAANNPDLANDWTDTGSGAQTFDITLAGFYDFTVGDTPNATFPVTLAYDASTQTIAELVIQLNTALGLISVGTGSLDDYVKFQATGTVLQVIKGDIGTLNNFGSQCSVTLADGSAAGIIADLGYNTTTNDSAAGGDTTYTAEGVAAKISALVAEATAVASSDIVTISSERLGTTSYIKIKTATTVAEDALALLHFTTADEGIGTNASNDGVVNFVAKDAGTWGDSIKVRTYNSTNPVTAATEYYIQVYLNSDSVEVFGPVDWTDNSATNFVQTLLESSNYVRIDFGESIQYPNADTDVPPTMPPPNNSDTGMPEFWMLASGDDGIPTDGTEADALAVLALDEYNNKEQYVIDLLVAPGFSGSAVVNKLQSVGETRQDILALVDPPPFLTYTDIINWHNGSYSGSTALTSSYTVLLWDWQRDFDAANEQYVDLPPSIYEAVAIAKTQQQYELWEAPAGTSRGIVGSISSYSKPTAAQREYLYNDVDPACVNPVVQFPAEGIMIYGQKTCLKENKAVNRIGVRRLVNSVVRNIELIGRKYIFQLNNASTWASISREINSYLSNIQERGGLGAFSVVFDSSTNTSDLIDQGIMYGKVFIQPTRVAERIFIDLTVQRTGALAAQA